MSIRTTHTYAELGVTPTTWMEVADKLIAAGYEHAFHKDGTVIDMHGIAIVSDADATIRKTESEVHVGHLEQEIVRLRALLLAEFVGTGAGIVMVTAPEGLTQEQVTHLEHAWKAAWSENAAPPLFVAFADFPIKKLEYNGSGLFAMNVPAGLEFAQLNNIQNIWKHVWRQTNAPAPPLTFIPDTVSLELLSDAALNARGLMRIPSGVNFAG